MGTKFVEEVPRRALDDNGHEIPDPRPLAIPAGMRRPETLAEQVARLVRSESLRRSAGDEYESFEESDDFDVDDDFDPSTPWETFFDPNLGRDVSQADLAGTSGPGARDPEVISKRSNAWKERYVKAQKRFFEAEDRVRDLFRSRPGAPAKARKEPPLPASGKGEAPDSE